LKRILIVEDNDHKLERVKQALGSDYEIVVVSDYKSAQKLIRDGTPNAFDLGIFDLNLPNFPGTWPEAGIGRYLIKENERFGTCSKAVILSNSSPQSSDKHPNWIVYDLFSKDWIDQLLATLGD